MNQNEKKPNFESFTPIQKKQIVHTVNILFKYKYNFIHYNAGQSLSKYVFNLFDDADKEIVSERYFNGMLWSSIEFNKNNYKIITNAVLDGTIKNPFDSKVIVIDEIHNFISLVVGGGYTCKPIYLMLMKAQNSKLVFLSGTPAINNPFELGILFNLLHGESVLHKVKLDDINNNREDKSKIGKILNDISEIDYYEIDEGGSVSYTLNPYGFINKYDDEIIE